MPESGRQPKKARKRATPKATPAQQRARREYLKMTGHKFDPERIARIRSQWVDSRER